MMNRRLLGIILIAILFILSISGIVMYFFPFAKNIASLHTFFALAFILAMVFHLINNKLPLTNYVTGKRASSLKKLQGLLVFLLIVFIAAGLYFDVPVLNQLYAYGNQIRNTQAGKTEETFDYQTIELEKAAGRYQISVELKKGKSFQYPLFAIWAEDSLGNYIETIYISRVISSSIFDYGKKNADKWESAIVRRPEALPYWSHKRGIQASDGLFTPLDGATDLDAVSGATPTDNFIIKSKGNFNALTTYRILIEINQSYDWNNYYTKDKFPDDKIYSGSGQVGQPSLIYASEINGTTSQQATHKVMRLVGHGHHSGKDGKLYKDVSQITTAKNIAERILLTVKPTSHRLAGPGL